MDDPRPSNADAHGRAVPEESLSPQHREALNRFILFWGEMASNWGINRTMAQIHALLYALEDPLDTDEIMERLQISRGNANMNLRSLINWNLVRKVHLAGSRKDYYTAEKDVWEIMVQIIRERQRREIQPVMQQLQECRTILAGDEARPCESLAPHEAQFCERIDSLMHLMEVFEGFSQTLLPLVQQRNVPVLKQLIQFTAGLHRRDED